MGWYRRFCPFSSRNKKPIQGWLSRSGFSTNNISHSLNHCFSSKNKKPIQGWVSRSSFSTNNISYSLNHCFSSRNKKPIQGWLSRSSFSNNISYSLNPRPTFSKSIVSRPTLWKSAQFQPIHPFLNGAGAKRFYHVDRYQLVSHFRRLCTAFSVVAGGVISAYCLFLIYLKLECSKTVPYTKRSRIQLVSWPGEKVTGRTIFGRLEAKFRDKLLPLDHPDSIRIRGIAQNIIDVLHRDLKTENHEIKKCDSWHLLDDLEFIVLDGPIEPCKYFGRKIIVSRGLLDHLTSDAEIATIIGHEVAHVVGRHEAEKVTKLILWSFPCLMDDSYLVDTFKFFEKLPFSRRLELEADYIGMMLMASAGYDPRVAPEVYEKLGEINNNNNNSTSFELLSRYPHAKTRVQSLTRAEVMKEALCRYREAQRIRGG